MASRIEDYALIGNRSTAALVARNGSIDWLTFPRFDSGACLAALLGTERNGYWKVCPHGETTGAKRRYLPGTLVLETEFSTPSGKVSVTDCMSRRSGLSDVLRLVRGLSGQVRMESTLGVRFDYGMTLPWINRLEDGRVQAIAGPDQTILASSVPIQVKDELLTSDFTVREGDEVSFSLTWDKSYRKPPGCPDVSSAIGNVSESWRQWSGRFKGEGPWSDAVLRSLITLQALTDRETGGVVAAPTTSLPEEIGGPRNWDYRYCWLRDATFTLYALMESGYKDEAKHWRQWLVRAVAGAPDQMQIMYGVGGERRLTEYEVHWLNGYEGSRPVRIGNAASEQLQLDVYGEVMDLLYQAHRTGLASFEPAWEIEKDLANHMTKIWKEPDDGIWEVRGGRRNFTHSKVMAWVTLDRAIKSIEELGQDGPLSHWRQVRSEIHAEVCRLGFDSEMGSFVQYFGGKELDASLLLIPQMGFLPPEDPRVKGTVAAIEKNLLVDGLVRRYNPASAVDGIEGSEGVFLPCSFWLADNYVLEGRIEEARELYTRLLTLRNDVGLLSEEYDPHSRRLVGNFPQAFSHVALVNTAYNLTHERKPAEHRSSRLGSSRHDSSGAKPGATGRR